MPTIKDDDFGEISVRLVPSANQIKIRLSPNGRIKISAPLHTPLIFIKSFLKSSKKEIKQLIIDKPKAYNIEDGTQIGKSHTLTIRSCESQNIKVFRHGQQIIAMIPKDIDIKSSIVSDAIYEEIRKSLRIEAKSYLPKRLSFIASKYNFKYSKIRFSHASSRWGSCSSNGTISLNIALMKLPFELIDYVIIHELSHTAHMNHSKEFWNLVSSIDNNYKTHRKQLKLENPFI